MPALPWTRIADPVPGREYVAMISRLPLTRYGAIPSFLGASVAIRRQLAASEGLIGYALDAQLLRKTFWTLSVWEDRDALQRFNHADPHRARAAQARPDTGTPAFAFWSVTAPGVPVGWAEARRHLPAHS